MRAIGLKVIVYRSAGVLTGVVRRDSKSGIWYGEAEDGATAHADTPEECADKLSAGGE